MSEDGADIGYSPLQGMHGALGGEQVEEEDRIKDMAEYLDTAPSDIQTYDDAARRLGKVFLDYLREQPEARDLSVEGLYSTVKESGYFDQVSYDPDGMSGFQVGWAANAARSALNLPPVANPAILTIEV